MKDRNHPQTEDLRGFFGHIYDYNLREYSKYFLEFTFLNSRVI